MGPVGPQQRWQDGPAGVFHRNETHQTQAAGTEFANDPPTCYEAATCIFATNVLPLWNGEYAKLVHATIYAPAVTLCTHFTDLNGLSATLAYV